MNRVLLVGRLTDDVQIRKTRNGKSVCSFNLAINEGKDAEGNEKAVFISCVAWEKIADAMEAYTSKGSMISVEGKLQNRSYEDPKYEGIMRYVTEANVERVEFLSSARKDKGDNSTGSGGKVALKARK